MIMHTLIATTLAGMSASAMNHVEVQAATFVEVGCFLDVQASANYTRALPVFFCSNGHRLRLGTQRARINLTSHLT